MDTNFINELYNEEIKSRNAYQEGILKKWKDKKEAKKKEQEEKMKKDNYDEVKESYRNLIKFLNYPFNFGFESGWKLGNIVYIAKILKINESQIINRIKKIKFKNDYTLENGIIEFYGGKRTIKDIEEKEGLKLNGANIKIKVIEISSNDDNTDFIGQDGKYYSIQTDDKLYSGSFCRNYENFNTIDGINNDIFVEVDKELGYYRLSNPPKNVKKKEFPL